MLVPAVPDQSAEYTLSLDFARRTLHTLVKILCKVAPVTPIRMMFHKTKNSTNTRITFSGFEQESQKELLLSLSRCALLRLKCVGGGGGSCIQSVPQGDHGGT